MRRITRIALHGSLPGVGQHVPRSIPDWLGAVVQVAEHHQGVSALRQDRELS